MHFNMSVNISDTRLEDSTSDTEKIRKRKWGKLFKLYKYLYYMDTTKDSSNQNHLSDTIDSDKVLSYHLERLKNYILLKCECTILEEYEEIIYLDTKILKLLKNFRKYLKANELKRILLESIDIHIPSDIYDIIENKEQSKLKEFLHDRKLYDYKSETRQLITELIIKEFERLKEQINYVYVISYVSKIENILNLNILNYDQMLLLES